MTIWAAADVDIAFLPRVSMSLVSLAGRDSPLLSKSIA